jgi:signal transduction histidine kinase
MDKAQPRRNSGVWAIPSNVQLQAQLAAKSPLPTALLEANSHQVSYANPAFLRLVGRTAEELQGTPFIRLVRDPDVNAVLTKVAHEQSVDLRRDLPYALPNQATCHGTTIITSVQNTHEHALLVQVIDTTEQVLVHQREAVAVREAVEVNQRLVLAALREQELSDQANARATQIHGLLDEKTILARVSGLLMASLDLPVTLQQAAEVAVPDFADGAFLTFQKADSPDSMSASYVLPRWQQGIAETVAAAEGGSADAGSHYLKVQLAARGERLGHVVFAREVSRPAFGEADRDLARELALRIGIALDNARLYEAARNAIRARDDVLSIVTHDLRNPLSSLMMGVQHLMMSLPTEMNPASLANSLSIMLRSAKHMRRMIDELLELASMQAGQLKLDYSQSTVSTLVREVLEMMEPQARQKQISIQTHLPDSSISVPCDPERILRALGNLLGNAIKFSPQGETILLRVERMADQVRFSLSDRAGGIAAEDISHLFDPYWKGTKSGRKGTGLGLYIARTIVEAHQGELSVESQLGVGSTFVFTLPLVTSAT